MNLKDLEKATKLYAELKEVDAKILGLEKFANKITNSHDYKVNLSFTENKEEKNTILDSDNSLKKAESLMDSFMGNYRFSFMSDSPKIDTSLSFSEIVDQKHFFMFIEYLMRLYTLRRSVLIKQLESFSN